MFFCLRQICKDFYDHSHIFLNHIVVITAIHANINAIGRLDICKGEFKSGVRWDASSPHDFIADARFFYPADCVNRKIKFIGPDVSFGIVTGKPYRHAARTNGIYDFSQLAGIFILIQIV